MSSTTGLYHYILGIVMVATITLTQKTAHADSLTSNLQGKNILSEVYWEMSDATLVCVVSKEPLDSTREDSLPTRTLRIYRESGNDLKQIFKYETPDSLLNIYSLAEVNGRLMTTWTGGSAIHIQVFAYLDGKVVHVLDAGSRGMPEVTINEDDEESILITEMAYKQGEWSRGPGAKTEIFRWKGKSYEKGKSVPWEKRFQ